MIKKETIVGPCRLLLGDCMEILPALGKFDAVVTDPPYGVGFDYNDFEDNEDSWGSIKALLFSLCNELPSAVCMSFRRFFEMPPALWQLSWHKPGSVRRSRIGGWSTWEPILLYGKGWRFSQDALRLPDCQNHNENNLHPCPKPLRLFEWICSGAPGDETLDPFMGSGTTGVACIKTGRQFTGIEIDEKYYDIAVRRCREAWGDGSLFDDKHVAEQRELFAGVA